MLYYKPISDIVKVTGMVSQPLVNAAKTDTFVLQMNYSTQLLHFSETTLASLGKIYLAGLRFDDNPVNGTWENAVLSNIGGPSTVGTPVLSSFQSYFLGNVGSHGSKAHLSFVLGDWGVDTVNHNVWAVIDYNATFDNSNVAHDAQFAAVPEPSTIVLAGLGFVFLTAVGSRNRRRRSSAV
jgi:hypothetical protein